MPPPLRLAVKAGGSALLLGVCWMLIFLPAVVLRDAVPLPQVELFLATSVVGPSPLRGMTLSDIKDPGGGFPFLITTWPPCVPCLWEGLTFHNTLSLVALKDSVQ